MKFFTVGQKIVPVFFRGSPKHSSWINLLLLKQEFTSKTETFWQIQHYFETSFFLYISFSNTNSLKIQNI